jgi:hypothetical protein
MVLVDHVARSVALQENVARNRDANYTELLVTGTH